MDKKKITNTSTLSVVIEDIGVRLSGRGAFVIIDASLLASSRLLEQVRPLLVIEDYQTSPSIWPVAVKPPPTVTRIVSNRAPPAPPKVAPTTAVTQAPVDLSPLTDRLDKLVSLMASAHSGAMTSNASSISTSGPSKVVDDVLFIPSSFIPADATSSLQVKTEEVVNSDISDSVAALRRMRGKL